MPLANGQPTMMEAILAGEEVHFTVGNKEACFGNPVRSALDGKHYSNQKAYRDHLKANGCHEVGTDYDKKNPKPREVKGDFNVRKDLTEATKEVLGRK